jgi:autotransporter-associated beta strand protein
VNLQTSATGAGTLYGVTSVGAVVVDAATGANKAVINPGNTGPGSAGTITMASLSVGAGTKLQFDAFTAVNADQIHVTGALTFGGATTITPTFAVSGVPITVIQADGGITGPLPTLGTDSDSRLTYSIGSNATAIQVTASGSVANLLWTGSADTTTWDLHTTQNFKNTGTNLADKFFNGDNVTFDATGSPNFTINIPGGVAPTSVTVNNATGTTYAFNGNGFIGGVSTLTKSGLGALTVATNNTFTGGTIFNAGTIQLSAANGTFNNFGAATSKITFNADGVTLLHGVSKTCQQPVDQKGDLFVHGTANVNLQFSLAGSPNTWTIFGNRKITVTEDGTGVFIIGNGTSTFLTESGGSCSLTKEGTGLMTMTSENSITSGFVINAGSVRLNATTITAPFGTSASTLRLNGGTLTTSADRAVSTPVFNPISITADSAVTTTSGSTVGATANLNLSSPSVVVTPGTTLTFRNDATTTGGNGIFAPRFSGGPFNYAGKIAIVNGSLGSTTLQLFNTTTNDQTFTDVISGTGAISRGGKMW